jgi:hypothetical protein
MKPFVRAAVLTGFSVAVIAIAIGYAASNIIAEDDASAAAYAGGWGTGKNGGHGFGTWALAIETKGGEKSYAGFYVADTGQNPTLKGPARNGKAFGMFTNGVAFEQAVAFRSFEKPLQVGDSFSFMLENGPFEKKFDQDDVTPGAIGLTLRSTNANSSVADYNKDTVFEFAYVEGRDNYQIYDGTENSDSGVALADGGVAVRVTLTGPDTYDLKIENLKDKKSTRLSNRKLNNKSPIESFAIFDRDGEKYDAFFNQFQITRESK